MAMHQTDAAANGRQSDQPTELAFQRDMFREYDAGNAHCFILHFNVYDYVFSSDLKQAPGYLPQRLRDYLGQALLKRGFQVVLYYSLSGGITCVNTGPMPPLLAAIPPDPGRPVRDDGQPGPLPPAPAPNNAPPQDPCRRAHYFGRPGSQPPIPAEAESRFALSYLYDLLTYDEPTPRIAVILEYLESIARREDSQPAAGPESAVNIELLHRLAMASQLRRRHLVVGLTADLGHVASRLYAAESEWRAFRVDLPAEDVQGNVGDRPLRHDRRDWLQYLIDNGLPQRNLTNPLAYRAPGGQIDNVADLAKQTSGFNYDNLRDILFYAATTREPITVATVHRRKRAIISAESRDLLEIVEPRDGFGTVAGYDYVKERLTGIKDAILRQANDVWAAQVVPKGILFLGPPGTGKSLVASALAKETGFNMVKLRNIRSMWVGETERNLNRVLDLLSGMHPVIVFVDEVDGAFVGRDNQGSGGGGVEQRIFQRILEFMAMDENRGRVLWIAASNRPDLLDAALLSRFDMVIPFLLPNDEARRAMFVTSFPSKNSYTFAAEPSTSFDMVIERTRGFSGRELDTISRRAMQLSANEHTIATASGPAAPTGDKPIVSAAHLLQALAEFRQARDQEAYELQTLLAIQATNFYPFLPPRDELPDSIRSEESSKCQVDESKLAAEILRLRTLLHQSR